MEKVLLTTVCGPFGINSDDCTEHIMPELFHAQVTRSQGIFSLRATYISYGLEYIANNISTPTTVLQYPTLKQFSRELKKNYDYVGISFVIATFEKLKKMSRMVREISPETKIILGGYGTMLPECEPYGDYICRKEGVEFMRHLLREHHQNKSKKHVTYPTRNKLCGLKVMKGAVVLAGLGCPHGCEFCATSHFHKQKHIPLLKTGGDLYREIRRVQKTLGNPRLPIGIIEEDFLMQKKRAHDYLNCVAKDIINPIRMSCFASASSIAQWDPEDLVRMGVDSVWIGVESKQADYTKLKNQDVKKIFETLHAHGINTLASLIIGHDFHTVEKVWNDFDYLISLNPSLSQFLILSAACSTPLYDRLKREGRLLNIPYKDCDGFHLTFNHPHISKPQMEKLLLQAYDKEYYRQGPSVIRYLEKKLAGFLRFKDSSDPLLRSRAEQLRRDCLAALPIFSTAVHYAPTKKIAGKIRNLRHAIVQEVGSGGIMNRVLSAIVPVFAFAEKLKLRHLAYSQPRLKRTEYRITEGNLFSAELKGKGILKIKPRLQDAMQQPLIVDLHGVFDRITAKKLKRRIKSYLKESSGNLALNFSDVTSIERDALLKFFKKLRSNNKRIKIITIDSILTKKAAIVDHARHYFEVFMGIESFPTHPL